MILVSLSTVSPLHTNIHVADFQGCECAFHQRQERAKLPLALCLLLLTTLQPYHLPPPPTSSSSSCLLIQCQTLDANCTTVLFKALYCEIKTPFLHFFYLFFMYYFVKSSINLFTVQSYVTDCLSWAPKLTSWDLWTDWTYESTLGMELVPMWGTYCIWNKLSFVAMLLAPQVLEWMG